MTAPKARRSNFVIFLADDLAWSDTGCFGGEISTPNIDELGYNGLRFTDFHTAALCSPTRAMLLTGTDHHLAGFGQLAEFVRVSPSHLGKPGHEGYLTENVVTFPRLLQDAGYFTAMAGKWHLGDKEKESPPYKGFDRSFSMLNGCCNHYAWEPPVEKKTDVPPFFSTNTAAYHRENGEIVSSLPDDFYSSDYYADKLIGYLDEHRENAPDQPFFAYLPFTAAHWPIQAPKENCDHYLGRYDSGPADLHRERLARQKAMGLTAKDVIPHPVVAPEVPAWEDMTPDAKARSSRTMEAYAGMVERMDHNVGKVVEYLKRSGQYDDTYIIFMSDNGESQSLRGIPWRLGVEETTGANQILRRRRGSSHRSRTDHAGQHAGPHATVLRQLARQHRPRDLLLLVRAPVVAGRHGPEPPPQVVQH